VAAGDALRALAAASGGVEVVCAGESMRPTLHDGDRVRVHRCHTVTPGDVVLFETRDGTGTVLHRVVARIPGTPWFVHCGDAGRRGGAGLARLDRVIGRADLPRRRPPPASYLAAITLLLRTARRRLRRR